jgi:hypothetical protein
MGQRIVIEEDAGHVSKYRPIKALAEKKVLDDGTVEISAQVSMLGITFTLEEIGILMRELPKAVVRAGALAAKLKTEHYEVPKITPVGNLHDRLAEVCSEAGEERREEKGPELSPLPSPLSSSDVRVVVIVSGQDVVVVADRNEKLTYVMAEALKLSGNSGPMFTAWEFRSEVGFVLSDDTLVKDLGWKPRIFLGPRAGIGGSDATLVAPVSLVRTRKDD